MLFKTLANHSYWLRSSPVKSISAPSSGDIEMSPLKKQKCSETCSDDTLQKKESKTILKFYFQKLLQLFRQWFS